MANPNVFQESPSVSNGYYLDNLVTTAEYLMTQGYSAAAASGIAGAIAGESGGDPESVGTGGAGLIAWTPPSKAAPFYPIVTGDPRSDFAAQLPDIVNYNNQQGQALIQQLNAQTDPVAAADFYSQYFERPLVTYSDVRPDVAKYVYAKVKGLPTSNLLTSGSPSTQQAQTTSVFGNPVTSLGSDFASGIAKSLGLSSVKDLVIRLGLILFGAILVIVGIAMLAGKPATEIASVVTNPAVK